MDLADYQRDAARTTPDTLTPRDALTMGALGLAGESGEVVELAKKHIYHGHPLDRDRLKGELGDVLWYVAALASAVGLSLDEVAAGNIEKLRGRYPEGFDTRRSQARKEGGDE